MSTIRNDSLRPEELRLKAILEQNFLHVLQYTSIYGYAWEVITPDGKHRIAHGEDKLEVMHKAVKYLEAKAVLTNKPMRGTPTDDRFDATRYAILTKLAEEQRQIKYKKALEFLEAKHVFDINKLTP